VERVLFREEVLGSGSLLRIPDSSAGVAVGN
jgi:hypothetical protein